MVRDVHSARSGVAIVRATLLVVTASSLDPISDISALTVVLRVLHPLVGLGAVVIDRRYAALGGILLLVSAVRLHRAAEAAR